MQSLLDAGAITIEDDEVTASANVVSLTFGSQPPVQVPIPENGDSTEGPPLTWAQIFALTSEEETEEWQTVPSREYRKPTPKNKTESPGIQWVNRSQQQKKRRTRRRKTKKVVNNLDEQFQQPERTPCTLEEFFPREFLSASEDDTDDETWRYSSHMQSSFDAHKRT